jgi:hypothetical protein
MNGAVAVMTSTPADDYTKAMAIIGFLEAATRLMCRHLYVAKLVEHLLREDMVSRTGRAIQLGPLATYYKAASAQMDLLSEFCAWIVGQESARMAREPS